MEKVSIDNKAKLSEHFTLYEMTKTKHVTKDGNIPSRVIIENLRRLCTDWLEELRRRYNLLYGGDSDKEKPIIINSAYRSPEVNRLAGGVASSNHLTGCAADIRCEDKIQLLSRLRRTHPRSSRHITVDTFCRQTIKQPPQNNMDLRKTRISVIITFNAIITLNSILYFLHLFALLC